MVGLTRAINAGSTFCGAQPAEWTRPAERDARFATVRQQPVLMGLTDVKLVHLISLGEVPFRWPGFADRLHRLVPARRKLPQWERNRLVCWPWLILPCPTAMFCNLVSELRLLPLPSVVLPCTPNWFSLYPLDCVSYLYSYR